MISMLRRSIAVSPRILIAVACLWGNWSAWIQCRADYLFRRDTPDAVRSAILLSPHNADYYVRLSQLDKRHAKASLEEALALNRYNASATNELALLYEANGDYRHAEKLLLDAFAVDDTYLPRWSLAHFYWRHNNLPAFWKWARSAAEMPGDNIGPLFALCWQVAPDSNTIERNVLNGQPEVFRQYLQFLVEEHQWPAAERTANKLIQAGDSAVDRSLLLSVVDQLAEASQASAATSLWRALINKNWIIADRTIPNNPHFERYPLPVDFDWWLSTTPGLTSLPGASGLETEFNGDEPESCSIADQFIALVPGDYTLEYEYYTRGIPPESGIHWYIVDAASNAVVLYSDNLSSSSRNHTVLAFSVAPGNSLFRLRLTYQRPLGMTRLEGTLVVASVTIRSLSKS